jgi:flagellar hook-associated protein 1 FlgK
MADLLNIGISGLSVTQTALATTGNNITNANTPGYSRQRVNFEPQPSQYVGVGYIGSGVKVASVTRIVDQLLIGQLRSDTATFHELDTTASQLNKLDSLLADQTTGLSPTVQALFANLQQASQDPTSIPVRQVVLGNAGSVAQRFNALYQQLMTQQQSVNTDIRNTADQITNLASNIAKLNQNIVAQSGVTGASPNSLLDQREELLRQMSELVGVKVVTVADGSVNVFMGSGQPLVIGATSSTMTSAPSASDPTKQAVSLGVGNTTTDVTQFISGGKLGGLVSFQNGTLAPAFNSLGRLAISMADAFNQQQARGVDLNGNTGKNLFTDINTASAQTLRVIQDPNNTGTEVPQMFIDNPSALTTSDYRIDFSSATAYSITRLSDSTVVNSGTLAVGQTTIPAPGSIDGFHLSFTAAQNFAAGDSFSLQPTRLGASAIDVALQKPEELAFSQPIRASAAISNTGGGTVTSGVMVPEYGAATPGASFNVATPLTRPLLVQYTSATTYQILDNTNPAAPVAFAPPLGGTITPGQNNIVQINDATGNPVYQITLAGNPASGDKFTVAINAGGTSDNRNALALAGLNLTDTIGTQTFQESYDQLVSAIGSATQSAQNNASAADTLLTQSQSNRDSVSAVNLDEEAANLIRFQQNYQASAQIINTARTLFQTLLAAFQ